MYCRNCGKRLENNALVCDACGTFTSNYANTQIYPAKNYAPEDTGRTAGDNISIAAFIISLVSLIFGAILAFPIVGIILSGIGLKNTKKGSLGRPFAIAGLAISIEALAAWILAIFFVILLILLIASAV